MKKKIILGLIAIVGLIGYVIGSYFVEFALKRENPNDIDSGPAACENIHDKTTILPTKPKFDSEVWSISSADDLKLNATHFSPKEESKHHWAILVHGYGRDQRYSWDYAEYYLNEGYEVLTPDLRSSGTSEGTYLTMGSKESDDILLWMDKVLEIDPEAKIILHGVSMGAATAMIAAAKSNSPNLTALIEDCGYTSAYDMFKAQLKVIFNLPSFPIMNFVDVVSKIQTGESVSNATPIDYVKNINVPTLFIHGTEDKLVPYFMMQELYDKCQAPVKEMMTVEGVGHASSKNANPDEYFNRIFSFLNQYKTKVEE